MVTAQIRTNVHRIFERITIAIAKTADVEWLAADIDIVISSPVGGTIIYDFNFDVATIVEITFDGSTFAPINEGLAVTGRQSRYLRVLNGDKINFRAKTTGNLNRLVVGEV